ncbi:MAG: hypothetical protein HYY15_00095 [Candidatus Omnitrophica bacterium]|nr:hypothetical protein [Candidatus Omnitrophota bacterium]
MMAATRESGMGRNLLLGALLLGLLGAGAGCARSRTVETETVVTEPDRRSSESPVVEKRVTKTETTTAAETPRSGGGLLSGLVHVIGEIIALPFRIVGGLVRLIF